MQATVTSDLEEEERCKEGSLENHVLDRVGDLLFNLVLKKIKVIKEIKVQQLRIFLPYRTTSEKSLHVFKSSQNLNPASSHLKWKPKVINTESSFSGLGKSP